MIRSKQGGDAVAALQGLLSGDLLHGVSFDDVARPHKSLRFYGDPAIDIPRQAKPASGKVFLRKTLGRTDVRRRFTALGGR